MKKKLTPLLTLLLFISCSYAQQVLVFHTIQTDTAGKIIPWYSADPGIAYDHDLSLIWNFWNNIPSTLGTKYYMTDHSYSSPASGNMVGGDQFAMALSSWSLYYAYTGDSTLIDNMVYIANTYLGASLSAGANAWPYLPYPSNYSNPTLPVYDGDFLLGAGYTQPDKAGSFANELVVLFKITGDSSYLSAALNIANTLAAKVSPGDSVTSPYPFKVNAQTGALPNLLPGANYTTNFVPTLELFESLSALHAGQTAQYDSAYHTIKAWVQKYPQHNNKWGCFFEDIFGPSNTETNAVTMARYILNHPDWDSTYQQDARSILNWTFATFADTAWNQYGATAIYEQTADLKPGGSHTSRYAATELVYADKTGDTTRVAQAIRELNWATYLVDTTGQCRFSPSESSVWYTDGYGDYARHYLRAMGAYPHIAPPNADHLVQSNAVITHITYSPVSIDYTTYDSSSYETLRLIARPEKVLVDGHEIAQQSSLNTQGWTWEPYSEGGALRIRHDNGHYIKIMASPMSVNTVADKGLKVDMYPNPAAESVVLHYSLLNEQHVQTEIFNLDGQRVKVYYTQAQVADNRQMISITDMAAGMYFVKVSAAQGSFTGKLLILNK